MKARLSSVEQFAFFLLGLMFYFTIAAGVWAVWINVLPYFWPEGPEEITSPSFWMFVGAIFLIAMAKLTLTK